MLLLLTVLSGLLLLPLLPIAEFLGFADPIFGYVFFAHLTTLLIGVYLSSQLFLTWVRTSGISPFFSIGVFLLFAGIIILQGLLPPLEPQVLSQQLYIPKLWLGCKGICAINWHDGSYSPMLINLGYAALLNANLEQLISLYNFLYLLLFCGLAAAVVFYKTGDARAAIFCYLLALSTPFCQRAAAAAMPDLGLMLFGLAAVAAALYWSQERSKFFYLILMGAAWGLAAGTRYAGLLALGAALPALYIFGRSKGVGFFKLTFSILSLAFIALALFSPWAARNAMTVMNPLYPLFKDLIGHSYQGVSFAINPISLVTSRYALTLGAFLELITIPLQLILFGRDGVLQLFDGVLGPLLLLAAVPFLNLKKPWVSYAYLSVALYGLFVVLLTRATVGAFTPILGLVFVLSGYGLHVLRDHVKERFHKYIFPAAILSQVVFALSYSFGVWQKLEVCSFFLNSESRETYLAKHLPGYDAVRLVNSAAVEGSRVWLIALPSTFYYYKPKIISEGARSNRWLIKNMRSSNDAEGFYTEIRQRGLSQIALNLEDFRRYLEKATLPNDRSIWTAFARSHLAPLASEGKVVLYKLTDPAPVGTPAPLKR